jgi:hypothetical protein
MEEHRIGLADLCGVVHELESGLIHASLGGGVLKQRLARKGSGKSGGFRTILIFRALDRAVFVVGFAKSVQDTLSPNDLRVLKALAKEMLGYDEKRLELAIKNGTIEEIFC